MLLSIEAVIVMLSHIKPALAHAQSADKQRDVFMRALNLLLAIGVIALLSTPVRSQQPGDAPARAASGRSGIAPAIVRGNALTATSNPLPNAPIRVRDAR